VAVVDAHVGVGPEGVAPPPPREPLVLDRRQKRWLLVDIEVIVEETRVGSVVLVAHGSMVVWWLLVGCWLVIEALKRYEQSYAWHDDSTST